MKEEYVSKLTKEEQQILNDYESVKDYCMTNEDLEILKEVLIPYWDSLTEAEWLGYYDEDVNRPLFYGVIKNKSELKVLLKQLEIIDDKAD